MSDVSLMPCKGEDPKDWLASVLECEASEITPGTSILTHPKWDSFAQVQIMVALSEECGIEMSEDNINQYNSYENIKAFLAG